MVTTIKDEETINGVYMAYYVMLYDDNEWRIGVFPMYGSGITVEGTGDYIGKLQATLIECARSGKAIMKANHKHRRELLTQGKTEVVCHGKTFTVKANNGVMVISNELFDSPLVIQCYNSVDELLDLYSKRLCEAAKILEYITED